MKTAVSIPDKVFHEAEKTAGELGLTRSALYATALKSFLKSERDRKLGEGIDAALAQLTEEDLRDGLEFVREAGRRTLARNP